MSPWNSIKTNPPPEGVRLLTRIDDQNGIRNEAVLVRKGNLWFLKDMSMYVYYTPTHWQYPSGRDLL